MDLFYVIYYNQKKTKNMNEIVDIIKNNIIGALTNNKDVPDGKKDNVAHTAAESILDGLKNNLNLDNISDFKNLLSGSSSGQQNNSVQNSIQNNVVSALVQKVGLSNGVSSSIASTIVPLAFKALSGKLGDGSFDIKSLLGMFSGGDNKDDSKGEGILGKIGNLFN